MARQLLSSIDYVGVQKVKNTPIWYGRPTRENEKKISFSLVLRVPTISAGLLTLLDVDISYRATNQELAK